MLLKDLVRILDSELVSSDINDYCPNGLQLEGKHEIVKIVTGVTASLALIEKAIALDADAILVHHGYFWKGEKQAIVGMKQQRIKKLLANNISLIAYHLPLDIHPVFGNNAQLGKLMHIQNVQALGQSKPQGIVMAGNLEKPLSHTALSDLLSKSLSHNVVSVGNKSEITTVAWCTGGGQNFIDDIVGLDVNGQVIDAFVSGEISEQTTHSALEQDIDFFAAGHHATERYGVKALGEWLMENYSLDVVFVDIHNPA
ncbi:MAG: dinuclear metal center YbgI/SA1388 family protein [Alphaproteobacteria bacterium]